MKARKLFAMGGVLALGVAFSTLPFSPADAATTGVCGDYAPDQTSVLLCNLGLKPKPPAPAAPTTPAAPAPVGVCADYAPNQTSVLLCNLGLLPKPKPVTPTPPVTPPATPTDPPTGSDACGPATLKADGTPWVCTFDDEFNGTSLDRTKWTPQTNFANGSPDFYACYVDDPQVVSESGGSLQLSVKKVSTPVTCPSPRAPSSYIAGQVTTFNQFSQEYGKFEARIKTPPATTPGLQESFWLWPDVRYSDTSTWPLSGEIDVEETYSQYPNLAIPFLHYSADLLGSQSGVNTAYTCASTRGDWHTYDLEWTSTTLKIFVDGNLCLTNTSNDPAFDKRYIVAFTQALGQGGDAWNGTDPIVPATTEIDYVRVWK